ncbi:sensor histidine kinase, partial [Streptomyces sp. DT17]
HSGARRCTVSLAPRPTLAGPAAALPGPDDGRGAVGAAPGHGLTGLTERLGAVGGTLPTGAGGGGRGIVLTHRVPTAPGAP